MLEHRGQRHAVFHQSKAIGHALRVNHTLQRCKRAARISLSSAIRQFSGIRVHIGEHTHKLIKKAIDGVQFESRDGLRKLQHHRPQGMLRWVPQGRHHCFVPVQRLGESENHSFKDFSGRFPE